MAEFRTIRMSFWTDPYIEELEPEAKLLYMYLFSSPYTNNLGIIETTRRKISYETGVSVSNINKYLAKFSKSGKVVIDEEHNAILLTRFIKHQAATSPKVIAGLKKLVPDIPSKRLADTLFAMYPAIFEGCEYHTDIISIPYVKGTDTVCIPSGEKEREREKEREEEYSFCAELDKPAHAPEADAAISLPLVSGEKHNVTQQDVAHWQELFPGVDVLSELRRMLAWLEANPRQRKTKNGIARFIQGWLDREQNRSRTTNASPAATQPRLTWQEEKEKRDLEAFLNDTPRPWEVQHG